MTASAESADPVEGDRAREQVLDLGGAVFYACALNELVEFAEHLVLGELKATKEQMKTEKWG